MRSEQALLALILGCGTPAAPGAATASEPPMTCTATVKPGEDLTPHLTAGATVCLTAGVHRVNLDLAHSLTLRGEPGAVLDGGGRGPTVRVGAHGQTIRLEGLQIRGGAYEFGSGVLIEGYSDVALVGCTIAGNAKGPSKGAGLGAHRGTLTVQGTSFGPDDDVVITTVVEASFTGATLGDLTVREGAKVTLTGSAVGGTLALRGTSTRQPQVTLVGSDVATIDNSGAYPGTLSRP